MKKKFLSLILAGAFSLSSLAALAACGKSEKKDENNTAPVINGVQETLTTMAGVEFDALAGVTATDAEDGNITNKIVVSSVPAMTFTNGKTTPAEAGEYTLVYSVKDSGNLEAEEQYSDLTVTPHVGEATTLVKFDFASRAGEAHGWESYVNEEAQAEFALKNGAYVVDVKNSGNAGWHIKLDKTIENAAPAEYRLKVWVKSSVPTFMDVTGTGGGEWGNRVGTEVAPIEVTYNLTEQKDFELHLEMGKITANDGSGETSPASYVISIYKIELYKTTGVENHEEQFKNEFNAESGLSISAGDGAAANVTYADGAGKINITSYPTSGGVWSIKADIALVDVAIESGDKYYYSVKVTAQSAQSGECLIESATQNNAARVNFAGLSFAEGETKTIEGVFTADKDVNDPVIRLQIGNPSDGVTSNVLTIDDVSFGKVVGDKKVEKSTDRFIAYGAGSLNETANNIIWDTFNGTDGDTDNGVGTIWTDNGSLFYNICQASTIDWHNKLVFGYTANPLRIPKDNMISIKFTAKATKAVSCPLFLHELGTDWDTNTRFDVSFTTEYREFTFNMPEALIVDGDFELLFQFGSEALAALGDVTIEFKDFEILKSLVS